MSPIVEFFDGNGRFDTGVRALSLALVLGVGVAVVWTTLTFRRDPPAPALVTSTSVQASLLYPLSDSLQETDR